jgi:uncharacterized repeat protein (TIGR02543 family)
VNKYTVTYYTGYGKLAGYTEAARNRIYTADCEIGKSVSLPVPVRSGYTFKGWYESGDFSGRRLRLLDAHANTVLYARWLADNLTWTSAFTDVRAGDWYYGAVKYVSQNGIMSGVSADSFEPLSGMTRGMLAAVLWRLEGSPKPQAPAAYADISDSQSVAAAVAWATESGIATGGDGNLFAPDSVLTRQEFITILYRYAQYAGIAPALNTQTGLESFSDTDKLADYAAGPMLWAVQSGLVLGTANGMLSPEIQASRAAAAALLMRFDQLG